MDPPPPFFPRHDHLRYGNFDFPPSPYGTHLPPPLFRPPHAPLSPSHAFSPPHRATYPYEFDPPPKPHFIRNDHLAHPEDMPLRFINDYPERNPNFEDEAFRRGCFDNYASRIPRNFGRNSHLDEMEFRTRVLDMCDHERYRDGLYRSSGIFDWRDGDERGWDNRINGWDREIERDYDRRSWGRDVSHLDTFSYIGRDYDDRRWNRRSINDRDPGMCHATDGDRRRWNCGFTDPGPSFQIERDYDEKWNSGISDRNHAVCSGRDYEDRRWHYGICESSYERTDEESRSIFSEALLKPENRRPECSVNHINYGRFNGRLERDVSKQEFNKAKKKRMLQKKNALYGIRRGKACSASWRNRGYKGQHFPKKLSKNSYRAKAKEGSEQLQMKIFDKREEQSTVDLAIPLKSNAFVANPSLETSHPEVESDFNSMNVDNKNLYIMSDSSFDYSEEAEAKEDHLTLYLDHSSNPLGISNKPINKTVPFGSGSLINHGTYYSIDNPAKNEDIKDKMSQVPTTFGSGRTQARQPRKIRNAGNQLLGENNLQLTEACDSTLNSYNCISSLSAVPQLLSDATVSRNNDMVELADNQESRAPELQEDNFQPGHESVISSEANASLPHMPAHSKETPLALLNTSQVGVKAEDEVRNLDSTAVADCSNASLGVSMGSHLLSLCHKEDMVQFDVRSFDAIGKKLSLDGADQSLDIGSTGGSRDAFSCTKVHSSFGCSSSMNGKRKASGAQMDLPHTKAEVVINKFGSIGGEIAKSLVKNLVPDVEVGFVAKDDSGTKNASLMKMSSGIEDSASGVDFGTYSSVHGYMKKRKVVSPRSNLSLLSDDDTVADVLATDCSMLVPPSAQLTELRNEQREVSVSAVTNKCGRTDVEDFSENWNAAGSDETLVDGNKFQVTDGLAYSDKGQSLCADDKNAFCASNSGYEVLASGFQMRSCMSSPEEMPSYTELKLSRNSEVSVCQSRNDKAFWTKDMSNRKPVPAHPNTLSLEKSSVKSASSVSLPTNSKSSPSPVNDRSEVLDKLNIVHGKQISSKKHLASTAPLAFPVHHPICFGKSRISNIHHVTKSRTWHRTCSSTGAVAIQKVQPPPLPQSHGTNASRPIQSSYIRKGNSLVRKTSPSGVTPLGLRGSSSSVYRPTPCTDDFNINLASNSKIGVPDGKTQQGTALINVSETTEEHLLKPVNLGEPLLVENVPRNDHPYKHPVSLEETVKSFAVPECQSELDNKSGSHGHGKLTYVKRRSNQLIAATSSDEPYKMVVDKAQASLSSDGYYKSKKNQLVRASSEDQNKKGDANVDLQGPFTHSILHRTSGRQHSGFRKGYKSKLSFVWKLQDAQSSDKHKKLVGPRKVWPHLFSWKKATHWKSFIHVLGSKRNGGVPSTASQKLLLSRRGAIYKRSTHGYSLRISKILSVSGASLKWSKSLERNSKKASEEATRAVAAAEKRKKEENDAVSTTFKSRNNVSRKSVLNVKLRPGDRIFRIGSERYKMDPTRRTLQRILDEKQSSPLAAQSEKKPKRSYVPSRLLIGNNEYVRIGNGNQLVRDPKKRTRILASEKVRWSLRTARLRLVRKKKYCQFFTRFGKCNKDDGKCPYIHDPSKIAVCTKFLNGLCSNVDCKLTHKVIPERMQDCSYFLKGSCSNENCPYRHVNVNPDSAVCESFLRGYCADGNECPKKHTYVCPAFEATGTCSHASTCKLHHPKKMEKKPTIEQKIMRGRYFDGGLIADCSISDTDKLSTKGSKDDSVLHKGRYPDYISLDISDNEEMDLLSPSSNQACSETLLDAQVADSRM